MISDSFIEELKYATDIEQIISPYIALKRRGRNLLGLCPFHSEKTPSFTVYPESQSYYCFGCGNGGDAITFIRQIENLEYMEALKLLAQKAGLPFPEDIADDGAARLKTTILEINRESARYFHHCLTGEQGKKALSYLRNRGLATKTIKRFGLGYAPEGWNGLRDHLRSKGYSYQLMASAAVVTKGRNDSYYDMFRDRVMFPIIDLRGNVIGFGGRIMEGTGPKYLNSPDTPVFKKSRNLFALNMAKGTKADCLILGEGYMDVIAIHQAGLDNAVATLGTSLTAEQSRLLARYTKQVVIAYDSDTAGQTAAKRAINLFNQTDISVRVLEIEDAKDPDEYIQKFGVQRFERLVSGGKSAMRFEIDKLRAQFDLDNPEDRVTFLNDFCRLMAGIHNPLQRDVYIGEIARELDIGRERLISTVETMRKRSQNTEKRKNAHNLAVNAQDNSATVKSGRSTGSLQGGIAEEKLITLLLAHPDYYSPQSNKIAPEDFQNPELQQIFTALLARIEAGQGIELIHLSADLPPPMMARVSKMLVESRDVQFYKGQVDEYIQVIRNQKNVKTAQEVAGMSPEEYQNYITSLRAKKK